MKEDRIFPDLVTRFFSNPIVGMTGSIASVLGLLLAIYFYIATQTHRELRYFVHPGRAIVVQAGQTSRLLITLDGEPVNRDVSAVQIAFWNDGNESIKKENVLRPLVIKTAPQFPILDVDIRKRSREIVDVRLNRSRMNLGELEIDWNILEQNDGAIIQLVYLGDSQVPITASSTIEGQGEIDKMEYSTKIQTPSEQYSDQKKFSKTFGYIFTPLGLSMLIAGIWFNIRLRNHKMPFGRFGFAFLIIGPVLLFAAGLYVLFWEAVNPGPPFGF